MNSLQPRFKMWVLNEIISGRVKARLKQDCSTVLLPAWIPTTQWCPECGVKNKLALSQRTYECACGYSEQRDVHAARNMILLGLLWSASKNPGQELAGTPVEGLSVNALESATVLLAPRKREALGKEVASHESWAQGPAEAVRASAQV